MINTRRRALRLNELQRLTAEELQAEKMAYKQAVCDIEGQIESFRREGRDTISASAALRHYRASLGFIAEVSRQRHVEGTKVREAVNELRYAARDYVEGSDSMTDLEHEAAFQRLRAAVDVFAEREAS